MKTKQITFTDLNSMSDKKLQSMQLFYPPSSETYKMIEYEKMIRGVELPEYMKLKN